MQNGARIGPEDITAKAVASFTGAQSPRTREVMRSLVRHLHASAADVGLTQEEWRAGIGALTATGRITDERRQEFILWSDALGLSMFLDALAHAAPPGATESTVLRPFYVPDSPLREYGANIAEQASGTPARVHGLVLDAASTSTPTPCLPSSRRCCARSRSATATTQSGRTRSKVSGARSSARWRWRPATRTT